MHAQGIRWKLLFHLEVSVFLIRDVKISHHILFSNCFCDLLNVTLLIFYFRFWDVSLCALLR